LSETLAPDDSIADADRKDDCRGRKTEAAKVCELHDMNGESFTGDFCDLN
jgi:hypothetical protein